MRDFECDCCGACCQGHLIVEAYELDLLREPRLLTADPYYAGRSLEDALQILADDSRCLSIAANRPCPLLGADCHCTIYPTRPNTCVAMEAGSDECQYAREAAGLEPLQPIEAKEERP